MKVFWRKGYEGASLPDLTKAMRINRPSIYAAFGNKQELFKKVLDRYCQGPAAYVREALEAPTARQVAERVLRGAVESQSDRRNPRGCLMVQGALACGDHADPIRKELICRRKTGDEAIRRRFERAVAEGDLPADADAEGLAQYLITVLRGMAVQAAGGANREQLESTAIIALRAWPQ